MKMKVLTAILLLIFFPSIQAQNSFKIVNKPYIHQQIGCDPTSGFQVGNYVCLMESQTMVVVDVSNPTEMEIVAGIDVESRYGLGLFSEEYLSIQDRCINISNPKKPFIENCLPNKRERPTVSYKLNKKELSVQCKVERGVETLAFLPLPEVEVIINRYGTRLFQINENLLAVFYDNLHFIDVSSPEDPQIVGTYTYNIPNAPQTSVSAMQIYDENTLYLFTDCGIDFIDFQNIEKPKLKGRYLSNMPKESCYYEKIISNPIKQNLIYVQIQESAGNNFGEIVALKHQNFQDFEEETIFQTDNGYGIQSVKPLKKNQRYNFFIQLDRLIAVDNHTGKLKGELGLRNRLSDFDIGEDYVFACGRNEFDSKMVAYQNNGNGDLTYLNVIRDNFRNACITANDDLLIVGGNGVGGTFEGFDFQVYDLLNVMNPKLLFDSKLNNYHKPNSVLAYNSLTLKNHFLITDAMGFYDTRGHWFITYDLSNPQQPKPIHQSPCKAGYRFFQFDNTNFWVGILDPRKNQSVYLAYPILKNNKAEVLQLEYESFAAMTQDSKIKGSVREVVKMLYDWKALPKPNSDEFLYKRLSVHKGYVYELQKNKGLRVYKVEEYGKRFEEEKR